MASASQQEHVDVASGGLAGTQSLGEDSRDVLGVAPDGQDDDEALLAELRGSEVAGFDPIARLSVVARGGHREVTHFEESPGGVSSRRQPHQLEITGRCGNPPVLEESRRFFDERSRDAA